MKAKEITLVALLSVIICISGFLKIPSIIPGSEFQLSAPIAVAICAIFGFKKYLTAGIMASIISLIIGAANIYSVIVAISFRIIVGVVFIIFDVNKLTVVVSGPLGTAFARLVLSKIMAVAYVPLLVSAASGMVFTALASPLIYKILDKVVTHTPFNCYRRENLSYVKEINYGRYI